MSCDQKKKRKRKRKLCSPTKVGQASLVAQLVNDPSAMQETPADSWVGKFPWRRYRLPTPVFLGFPGGSNGKESACNAGDQIQSLGQENPWRMAEQPTPVFLPRESPWTEEPGGPPYMES